MSLFLWRRLLQYGRLLKRCTRGERLLLKGDGRRDRWVGDNDDDNIIEVANKISK